MPQDPSEKENVSPAMIPGAGKSMPIISAGDICGSIAFVLPDDSYVPDDTDVKLAQVAATFLGKQMEE